MILMASHVHFHQYTPPIPLGHHKKVGFPPFPALVKLSCLSFPVHMNAGASRHFSQRLPLRMHHQETIMKPCPILLCSNSTRSTSPMAGQQYLGGQQRWVGINLITHSSAWLCVLPLCASTVLSKHGDPFDRRFPDCSFRFPLLGLPCLGTGTRLTVVFLTFSLGCSGGKCAMFECPGLRWAPL